MKPTIHQANVITTAAAIARAYAFELKEHPAEDAFCHAVRDVLLIDDENEWDRWIEAFRPIVDQFLKDSADKFNDMGVVNHAI